jgi:hypothetical protein
MDPSDSIGLVPALVLAASALYRTLVRRRESRTAGLWSAAFATIADPGCAGGLGCC